MAKRPTNNTIAMKLSDAEIEALMKVAEDNEEKTTTQAKACLLFGLEMTPVLELVRSLLKEEGRFGTNVRMIEPRVSDEECLKWIQNLVVEGVYVERNAIAKRAERWQKLIDGNPPERLFREDNERQKMLYKHGYEAADRIVDEAVRAAVIANGWTDEEIGEAFAERTSEQENDLFGIEE